MMWGVAQAQMLNPVTWTKSLKMTDEHNGVISFTAKIDKGWHMYSPDTPDGGPVPLSVNWNKTSGVKLVGGLKPSRAPQVIDDPTFEMKVHQWEGSVTLSQKFTTTGKDYNIDGDISYMCCNDQTCTAPTAESFKFTGKVAEAKEAEVVEDQSDATVDETIEDTPIINNDSIAGDSANIASGDSLKNSQISALWAPVIFNDNQAEETGSSNGSLWFLFFTCFLGGFLALLTPCVWPIIPMTVSFFLKSSDSKSKSLSSAITYGISIIVIYVALGLIVTAILGPNGLNALATNAVCNIIFFLLLL